jgi:hypothetical protein
MDRDGSSAGPGFFLPVRVLSRLFRRLFLEGIAALHAAGRLAFFGDLAPLVADKPAFEAGLAPLRRSEWVVHGQEAVHRAQGRPRLPFETSGPRVSARS